MLIKIDHLSFQADSSKYVLGQDFQINGQGWINSSSTGEILLDVVRESDGVLSGVCQARIKFSSDGTIKLKADISFSNNSVYVLLRVNGFESKCEGVFAGDFVIFNFILLNASGNFAYEYKIRVPKEQKKGIKPSGGRVVRIYAPTIVRRDAIGNYCLWLQDFFSKSGFKVITYSDGYDISETPEIKKAADLFYEIESRDLIFVVYSTYDRWVGCFASLANFKVLSFQNVTPSQFYRGWDNNAAAICDSAVVQFPILESFDLFFSSTKYTAEYLNSCFNIKRDFIIVPPFGLSSLPERISPRVRDVGKLNLLFVGRVVPNKGVDDIVELFRSVIRRFPTARLNIVGSTSLASYVSSLKAIVVDHFGCESPVNFAGSVSDAELDLYFRDADAMICMSNHEGFCVPVYEAMSRRILVCATNQPAVAEVLGGTGLLFDRDVSMLSEKIAESLIDVCGSEDIYDDIVDKQFERALVLAKAADGAILLQEINSKWV